MSHSERNFWLDFCFFVTSLLTSFTGLVMWAFLRSQTTLIYTGYHRESWFIAHLCCGLASVLSAVLHVVRHKEWLRALRGRSIASLPLKLKANRILDRIIWISFLNACVFGGLAWGFPVTGYRVGILSRLHVASSILFLVGIIVHLVFHRKWISSTIRRHI